MSTQEYSPTPDGDRLLYYISKVGPVYVKKLAEVLKLEQPAVRDLIRELVQAKFVERETKTNVSYNAGKRGKVVKHRNHTYFKLTRKGKHHVRAMKETPDVAITPVYKRASN